MFGVSFPELVVLGTVALLVLGPQKLPGMLRTMGQWIAKLRRLTTEVRYQSGIDEVLRAEGFDGGLNELRSMMRGGSAPAPSYQAPIRQPVVEQFVSDKSREYPIEGPDAYGALPEDLVSPAPAALPPAPETPELPPGAEAAQLPSAGGNPTSGDSSADGPSEREQGAASHDGPSASTTPEAPPASGPSEQVKP